MVRAGQLVEGYDVAAGSRSISLYHRWRELPQGRYVLLIGGLAALSFGMSFAALFLTPEGGTTAIWWPAAGVTVLLYLAYRGPKWQVLVIVAIVAAASNLMIGRPPLWALWGIGVLVFEVVVFAWVLGPQGRSAMLGTTRGLLRFLGAVAAGALAVSLAGATSFGVLVGANPVGTFLALVPSHLSALLVIVPLALVPLPRRREASRTEEALQVLATTGATVAVFAPMQVLPITAILFLFFGWAASRFRPMVATIELILLANIASVMTALGFGPFGVEREVGPPATLVQVFLLSMALTTLYIIVVRSERAALRAEGENRAAMLRGGFVGSQVGSLFVLAQPGGEVETLEINDVARDLVDSQWLDPLLKEWSGEDNDELATEITLPGLRTIQVFGSRLPTEGAGTMYGLQILDVTNFIAAQQSLERSVERERQVADELRALAQQKDDFISSVSHELRTPITSIVGFAEELEEGADEATRTATTIITRNAVRLSEMVEELLELGKMTAPNPVRDHRPLDLNSIASEAIDDQQNTARQRNITVTHELSSSPTLVLADENSLSRIATNLLSNAIKFAPDGGDVRVTTTHDGGQVRLSFEDSGSGISAEDRPRIFERFYRSGDEVKRQTPGTGLGLSIVKALTEMLGGTITVEDSPLGGARMSVVLPLAPD